MDGQLNQVEPSFLTTREVAQLLRVKERKVYDLAAAGDIPHRRVTGKLLFPKHDLLSWIDHEQGEKTHHRPPVVAGSHDPLLDWAIRESNCGLATLVNGSGKGLEVFTAGDAAMAGMHIPEQGGSWNIQAVQAFKPTAAVLLNWSVRNRGLIVARKSEKKIKNFDDIRDQTVVARQAGSGAAQIFDLLIKNSRLTEADFNFSDEVARTESDAAAAVAAGDADIAIGIEAMAARFDLGFVTLIEESFDLLIDHRAYFTPPIQTLFAFTKTKEFKTKAATLGGYNIQTTGEVRWNSPSHTS